MKVKVGLSAIMAFLLAAATGQAASGVLAPLGNISHLAWGGGWQTVLFLNNYGATDATVVVNSYDDNGVPIALPWTDPFTSARTGVTGAPVTSLDVTIKAGSVVAFLVSTDDKFDKQAWAQVLSDSKYVTGGVNFKYNVGQTHGEAMVPLDTGAAKAWDLLFFGERAAVKCEDAYEFTSYAIANPTASPVTVTRTVVDRTSGVQKYEDQVTLPAHGHTAFVGFNLVRQPDNTGIPSGVWMLRVSAPGPNQITPLTLHFRQDKAGVAQDGTCQLGPLVFESVPTWPIQ